MFVHLPDFCTTLKPCLKPCPGDLFPHLGTAWWPTSSSKGRPIPSSEGHQRKEMQPNAAWSTFKATFPRQSGPILARTGANLQMPWASLPFLGNLRTQANHPALPDLYWPATPAQYDLPLLRLFPAWPSLRQIFKGSPWWAAWHAVLPTYRLPPTRLPASCCSGPRHTWLDFPSAPPPVPVHPSTTACEDTILANSSCNVSW